MSNLMLSSQFQTPNTTKKKGHAKIKGFDISYNSTANSNNAMSKILENRQIVSQNYSNNNNTQESYSKKKNKNF